MTSGCWCAILATAAMSTTFIVGFVGVSSQTICNQRTPTHIHKHGHKNSNIMLTTCNVSDKQKQLQFSIRLMNYWSTQNLLVSLQCPIHYPIWAHCTYGWQCGCQENYVRPSTVGLEKTSRTHRITWLITIQHDLRCHNLTLHEAVDMAQNRVEVAVDVRRYAILRVACQKRQKWQRHWLIAPKYGMYFGMYLY